MLKIGIIHGPNLNRLGERKEKCYGTLTLEEINERLEEFASKGYPIGNNSDQS